MLCRVQKYFQKMPGLLQTGSYNFYILWNTVEFPADIVFACDKAPPSPRTATVLGEETEDNLYKVYLNMPFNIHQWGQDINPSNSNVTICTSNFRFKRFPVCLHSVSVSLLFSKQTIISLKCINWFSYRHCSEGTLGGGRNLLHPW